MVRNASRNTVFTSPQGWVGEIVSQVRTGGFLTFEYHVWRDQKSKDNGEPAFLLNNHKAQIRETHQRIRTDNGGKLLHRGDGVTPLALTFEEVDDFLKSDARSSVYTQASRLDQWTDSRGRTFQPFVFPNYVGDDEPLDPQWLRDTVQLPQQELIESAIFALLSRAESRSWEGDLRGTTLNLQVGSSGGDGQCQGTLAGAPSTYSSVVTGGTIGSTSSGAGISSDCWSLFTGVSGLSGATINSATYSLYGFTTDAGTPLTALFAADAASAAAPADVTEFNAYSLTTASVTWDSPGLSTSGFTAAPDAATIIQELATDYDPSTVLILHYDTRETDTLNRAIAQHYDVSSSAAPKLDIDYTAGGGGDPEGSFIRGKLIRGGLLRGGVLVG